MRSSLAHVMAALLIVAGALALPACTQRADPAKELALQLRQGIRLLEQKQDEQFLDRFMAPEDYAKYFPNLDRKGRADQFRRVAADKLEKRLREAVEQKPTVSPDQQDATYPLQPEVKLRRIDGRWRILN